MSNEENNKSKNNMSSQDIEEVKDNDKITDNVNYLKYEIFKDNIFSEEGFNNYIKNVEKVENVKNDMKSIINKDNAKTDNLDLIRESRIIHESKQNYNTLNDMFFSILLTIGSFIFGLFWKDKSICFKLVILSIFVVITLVIEYFIFYQSNKKIEEKRAATYFWLETEIEKRIKDSEE